MAHVATVVFSGRIKNDLYLISMLQENVPLMKMVLTIIMLLLLLLLLLLLTMMAIL
jgi:hypothetical protein